MNLSTKPWTFVLAAALIALPASGIAQTPPQQPPATPPPTTQPPATPQPPATTTPATQPPAEQHQAHSPAEHLAKAKAALNEVETTAVTGDARTKLTELKRHMASLDRAAAAADKGAPSATPKTTPAKPAANWATDVAAIDRILTDLTTPMTAGDPAPPTGTTGTTGTTGGSASRAKVAVTMDEATRAKLLEVRTHITAFAAAMSGSSAPATPKDTPTTAPLDPTMPATPPTPPPATTTPPTEPPVTTQPPTTPPTAQPPTTTPAPPTTPITPTTPTDPSAPAPASESGTVDKEGAKRHLTEARDTLSQITQLPEAAQLTGDARTQVSEMIANFNELITTQTEWRATYAKLQANLTALVGAETSDEPPVTPPATGEPGAVGTSGMTTLDPKIREKLVEFRSKLAAFERAAGESEGTPK